MNKKIDINKEFLEKCGQNSLQGLLVDAGATEPQPITLHFHQTSYAWRIDHGGPDIYLVPEFAPYCLLESVLSLVASGYAIDLEWSS